MSKRYTTEIGRERRKWHLIYLVTLSFLGAATLIVLILLFFLRNPLWRVRAIEIQGNKDISTERIYSLLLARVLGDSQIKHFMGYRNMLAWASEISPEDLAKFMPEAQSITLEKDYLRGRITAKVVERGRVGIWCFRQTEFPRCFWFDKDGFLVVKAPANEGSLLLTVNDYTRSCISVCYPGGEKEALLRDELLTNLFSIFEALKDINLNTKEIRLDNLALEEIVVPTWNGPTLYFSLRFPATNTPQAFTALREKTPISNLEYIDFRAENRIYYK